MKFIKTVIIAAFLTIVPNLFLVLSLEAQCLDIPPTQRHLNVMTINLLFSEIRDREMRLREIADFVIQKANSQDPIDLILLQEVVGGEISRTVNTSLDLRKLLAQSSLNYGLSYRLAIDFLGLFSVGNAILSRYRIQYTLSTSLPSVTEEIFEGLAVPVSRNAMMSRINIPGFGKINVYNVHLCAYCDPAERLEQALVLADFIEHTETFIRGENPIILGGDFNTDLNISEDFPLYDLMTNSEELGLTDTYAEFNSCKSCCEPEKSYYDGCTYAVPDNPYAVNPFTGQPDTAARIDYIFRSQALTTLQSCVIFNRDPNWVSDHSAVLTSVGY